MTNRQIAQLLRQMAAAYEILGENRFRVIAYERAADGIEHLAGEAKDYWDEDKLDEIPGVGSSIAAYLGELFRTGKVRHFESVMRRIPGALFPLLAVPGIGPKKAYTLVTKLKFKDAATVLTDLQQAAKAHKIASIPTFGEKSEQDILASIQAYQKGAVKQNRMVLSEADAVAEQVISYLQKNKQVERVDTLGSLRRQVSTIGDIDLAVATTEPAEVLTYFLAYPHEKIIEQGPSGATLLLGNGRQLDLRVQPPGAYGAMLQYFTGSKNHNVTLRTYALQHGKSLNEYGIKTIKDGKLKEFSDEETFYKELGMDWIPPEIREDRGEIEAALAGKLPRLVDPRDIKGDLHMHTDYDVESSHDIGSSSLAEHLDRAVTFGYEYIGVSDHNPSVTKHTPQQVADIMKRRQKVYEQKLYSWKEKSKKDVHMFVMCEVDILPDGRLALPNEAFEYVDAVIVSIHSSFKQDKKRMTNRVVKALESHPKVRIFGHPTGRLLQRREGIELDWAAIFAVCSKRHIALEIDAFPDRLDLPDTIVREAVDHHIPLCIDSDAHQADQMQLLKYGVSVARRGWATKRDIVNTLGYNEFRKWLTESS